MFHLYIDSGTRSSLTLSFLKNTASMPAKDVTNSPVSLFIATKSSSKATKLPFTTTGSSASVLNLKYAGFLRRFNFLRIKFLVFFTSLTFEHLTELDELVHIQQKALLAARCLE